jgi:hypothetical protein
MLNKDLAMTNSVLSKGELTRRLNVLAGVRPPLPGQSHLHEQELRRSICECFKPSNAVEMLVVNDIAYVSASIEVLRAQVAGFRMRAVRESYRRLRLSACLAPAGLSGSDDDAILECFADTGDVLNEQELAELEALEENNFVTQSSGKTLGDDSFAILLGHMNHRDMHQLEKLQQMLHAETRERDRLINQIDKRRRQAMRDAIEWADAERRAKAAEASDAKSGNMSPNDDGDLPSQDLIDSPRNP